ncbi:hypothetical protein K402DRAFT_47255 [Aulographum hederae CBS 113979]|uniref:Uncharacterized protein n=1 Tax=Aulographum hederae CBS 113979 TaxID=1176131 RepID=A0A6G1H2E1_9PEZI|nr:hypothetical protein K402DRAFT_47255 [Aulographum hederae CBS 113979]
MLTLFSALQGHSLKRYGSAEAYHSLGVLSSVRCSVCSSSRPTMGSILLQGSTPSGRAVRTPRPAQDYTFLVFGSGQTSSFAHGHVSFPSFCVKLSIAENLTYRSRPLDRIHVGKHTHVEAQKKRVRPLGCLIDGPPSPRSIDGSLPLSLRVSPQLIS